MSNNKQQLIFKPEDFIYVTGYQADKAEQAAKLANEKLNDLIEDLKFYVNIAHGCDKDMVKEVIEELLRKYKRN